MWDNARAARIVGSLLELRQILAEHRTQLTEARRQMERARKAARRPIDVAEIRGHARCSGRGCEHCAGAGVVHRSQVPFAESIDSTSPQPGSAAVPPATTAPSLEEARGAARRLLQLADLFDRLASELAAVAPMARAVARDLRFLGDPHAR